jgi:cupin fold WbuC family metalloprotein
MRQIFSNVEEGVLLHAINRLSEITEKRQDISPDEEYMQVACFELPEGKTFQPHKHIPADKRQNTTQESWVVIRGRVKAILYDLDDTIVEEVVLEAGDCSITYRGGHDYESMEEGTVVYEYKTGPYHGQALDKVFI